MEAILVTLATIGAGACLAFAAHRLGQAHLRLAVLRNQRQRDGRCGREGRNAHESGLRG